MSSRRLERLTSEQHRHSLSAGPASYNLLATQLHVLTLQILDKNNLTINKNDEAPDQDSDDDNDDDEEGGGGGTGAV